MHSIFDKMTGSPVILCTGGIGSGKSYVVRIFNSLGIPSYDCDARVKALYDEDPILASAVDKAAGGGLMEDGRLDRKKLAAVIFSRRNVLEAVEALVHPVLLRDFSQWRSRHYGPVVIESAILLEKPALASVPDVVVSVTAPLEIRVRRVMERDLVTREEVLGRMANQMGEEERIAASDYVVKNDGKTALLPQIVNILKGINNNYENGKDRS